MAGRPGTPGGDGSRLNAAEVCAVSYVILWESLERHTLVILHAALVSRMLGGQAEVPDMGTVRADFDAALAQAPKTISPTNAVIMRAIGLR